jgi:SAM-dependent methyltransferase
MKQDKTHWENIYRTKQSQEVSWTQEVPKISLDFVRSFKLPKTASIIDIGGGDSKLADFLLDAGYEDVTVLDISGAALERAEQRLGSRADKINWVEQDITRFEPTTRFDLWHDRAAFHFLTTAEQINRYLSIARKSIKDGGYAVIGTFSPDGPEKCSGLPVRRYDEQMLAAAFSTGFKKISCITEDHITPFQTKQNFLFCSFQRIRQDLMKK